MPQTFQGWRMDPQPINFTQLQLTLKKNQPTGTQKERRKAVIYLFLLQKGTSEGIRDRFVNFRTKKGVDGSVVIKCLGESTPNFTSGAAPTIKREFKNREGEKDLGGIFNSRGE